MDFSNELALNSTLSTFNNQFDNLYYFYRPINEFTNLYIVAVKKGSSKNVEGLKVKLNSVPSSLKPKVIQALRNANKFQQEDFNYQNILSDKNNQFSIIFAKVTPKFRKTFVSQIPSRILIN